MDTENGEAFIKHLAYFVRTHEKALANALQLKRQAGKSAVATNAPTGTGTSSVSLSDGSAHIQNESQSSSASSALAAALSLPSLSFTSHSLKPATLELTAHHLFYLLSRFEDLGISVGAMNIRLENIHADIGPGNYVSFLSQAQSSRRRGSDRDSIHSVSSVRSVMSGMSSLWSTFGLGSKDTAAKTEKAKVALEADTKYLYSSFTKIPCLKLRHNHRARLIQGYEEFPFDTALPLIVFKNLSALEIVDVDFRQYYGWDRLADQLRSLSVKRGSLEDPAELLNDIVLDDMDKRRRRSSKQQVSPVIGHSEPKRFSRRINLDRATSAPGSPKQDAFSKSASPKAANMVRGGSESSAASKKKPRPRSISPTRASGPKQNRTKSTTQRARRSGSNSSQSSTVSFRPPGSSSSSNLLLAGQLPATKWRFLKHLCIADNGLTTLSTSSLAPLANTLHSLDLSCNLFQQVPDALSSLTALRALNLSECMIDSLHSLLHNPIPAITALNLRNNRLKSLAGIEKLRSLERLDLRGNKLTDPTELARLTGCPEFREVWLTGNTFTKSYESYRITIFNLFRKTPGYSEDILIDSTGPSYSERKHLHDRIVESPSVPVIKSVPKSSQTASEVLRVNKPLPETPSSPSTTKVETEKTQVKELPAPLTNNHQSRHASSQGMGRRRPTKRRIVDVSREMSPNLPDQDGLAGSPGRDPRGQPGIPTPEPLRHTQADPEAPTGGSARGRVQALSLGPTGPGANPPSNAQGVQATGVGQAGSGVQGGGIREMTLVYPPPRQQGGQGGQQGQQPSLTSPLLSPRSPMRSLTSPLPLLNTSMSPPPLPSSLASARNTPTISNTLATPISATTRNAPSSADWAINSEIYKRKIEALRNEVGNGWLNVLSEEGGENAAATKKTLSPISPASTIKPSPTTPRASAQQGRTLG